MAPVALNVAVSEVQIVTEVEFNVNVGVGLTVILICLLDEHASTAPTTLYVVLLVGVTVTVVPVRPPGFHVYVVAPDAVNVTVVLAQIVLLEALKVIVGVEQAGLI